MKSQVGYNYVSFPVMVHSLTQVFERRLFIFREQSTRKSALISRDGEQGDLFYSAETHGKCVRRK